MVPPYQPKRVCLMFWSNNILLANQGQVCKEYWYQKQQNQKYPFLSCIYWCPGGIWKKRFYYHYTFKFEFEWNGEKGSQSLLVPRSINVNIRFYLFGQIQVHSQGKWYTQTKNNKPQSHWLACLKKIIRSRYNKSLAVFLDQLGKSGFNFQAMFPIFLLAPN